MVQLFLINGIGTIFALNRICSNYSIKHVRSSKMTILAVKEEIILSALMMLGGSSHGAPLRKKVIELSKKEIVYGTLYNLLEILIRKGYVVSQKSDPMPVRGGRSKTKYSITNKGKLALEETLLMHERIKNSVPSFESGK